MPRGTILRVANPLSREHDTCADVMNTTWKRRPVTGGHERVAVFEIAAVYLPVGGQLLPISRAGWPALTGRANRRLLSRRWRHGFLYLKAWWRR